MFTYSRVSTVNGSMLTFITITLNNFAKILDNYGMAPRKWQIKKRKGGNNNYKWSSITKNKEDCWTRPTLWKNSKTNKINYKTDTESTARKNKNKYL